MITPVCLVKGDAIGIVAPARFIEQEKYNSIIQIIEEKGFRVIRGKTTFLEHHTFAGTDEERRLDLQEMLDSKQIKAIFCLRGGYGTIRIIDKIDFTQFKTKPKWLIGFSDITILHNAIHNLTIESIHGQMPLNFAGRANNQGLEKLFDVLVGKPLNYQTKPNKLNKYGASSGSIIGGNVAILSSLIGTPFDIDTSNKILFIEDVGEHLYRFDRLMHHLKFSGKLNQLNGLIVGGLTDLTDGLPNFVHNANEIVLNAVKDYSYPVCFDFPAGHISENFPLILGREIDLNINHTETNIIFKN